MTTSETKTWFFSEFFSVAASNVIEFRRAEIGVELPSVDFTSAPKADSQLQADDATDTSLQRRGMKAV